MGSLFLVRHGQASFGADDYDQLSELGTRQCRRLGEYLHTRGQRFDAVLVGTLQRHRQSLAAISEGLPGFPAALDWPGLNEYDSHALIQAIHPEPLAKPDTPELYRHHFRLLRQALEAWMNGTIAPQGMPSYEAFRSGVVAALDHVREHHHGNHVLLVSSGGPISTAVGHIVGSPAAITIDLNMRIRNSALTEFAFTPKRHMLVSYNTVPHLDDPQTRDWVTYA